jgi:hypothetical protein
VDYVDHHAGKHPIVVQAPHENIEVRWEPSLKCRKQTQLNLTAKGVWVKAVCLTEDGPLRRFEAFGGLVADLAERRLGLIEEGQGWVLYQELYRIHLHNAYSSGGRAEDSGPVGDNGLGDRFLSGSSGTISRH